MRAASSTGQQVFQTHWVISGNNGVPGLPASIRAIRTAGLADGTYSDGLRIFYERPTAWLTFLYYDQGHPQLIQASGDDRNYPCAPMVRAYNYPPDHAFMALMPAAMKVANPAYGSGTGQALTNVATTTTGQGLCLMACYERLTGLDFVETVLKPVLRGYFAQTSDFLGTGTNLPTDWAGVADFDYETWYPKLTRTELETGDVTTWGDDMGEYFIRWCRTGAPESKDGGTWDAVYDLEPQNFTYCPQVTGPMATDQAAIDLFWSLTYRLWVGIKEVMLERAPNSKLGVYGWPPVPGYYDCAYFQAIPAYENTGKVDATNGLAAFIAKYTNPAAEGMIVELLDRHEPSMYFGTGDVTAPGVPETVTYPVGQAPYVWSYWQRSKHVQYQCIAARAIADHYGKPLMPYIDCTFSTPSDLYGSPATALLAKLYGDMLISYGADSFILWGYWNETQGNTEAELLAGLPLVEQYMIDPARVLRKPLASTPSYVSTPES